ncbi:nitroreductase family deazaflavin-dependent oxidoreductase [Amycolatopsis acidicola]|uniref:Nitroreductase family deazaflavin-dependent oxidoreductase n=1 Tax=Amycolatopsis acidicola TaxID=2596893 RepID=A0A5N0VJT1_9PSEU|nr:nitroreductase/quinone reductase family protein [Amycolatopsis acidicola]KAA9165614.1 nitroreductase family deazaflavin-dependent oxidoreductase [Amycolatopsis acidicola]
MTTQAGDYRRKVNAINRFILALSRAGLTFGPMQMLTVAGRRSGQPRTFPIAVLKLSTGRYIVQAFPRAAWVANVRAAETARLKKGFRTRTVRLVELPVEERPPVLREVVSTNGPSVGKRYVTTGLASSPTPDGVAAAAERIAVFRVEDV